MKPRRTDPDSSREWRSRRESAISTRGNLPQCNRKNEGVPCHTPDHDSGGADRPGGPQNRASLSPKLSPNSASLYLPAPGKGHMRGQLPRNVRSARSRSVRLNERKRIRDLDDLIDLRPHMLPKDSLRARMEPDLMVERHELRELCTRLAGVTLLALERTRQLLHARSKQNGQASVVPHFEKAKKGTNNTGPRELECNMFWVARAGALRSRPCRDRAMRRNRRIGWLKL
jgi:hypothetical protein